MKKGSRLRQWIGYFIIVAGLAVLASPFVQGYIDGNKQQQVVKQFWEEAGISAGEAQTDTEHKEAGSGKGKENKKVKSSEEQEDEKEKSEDKKTNDVVFSEKNADPAALYQAALSYNQNLFATRQSALTSTEATEVFPLNARNYGYSENTVGTIWIPRMDVELGLYLGANNANMANGAAIFGQTSIPLGQPNENASIAGHRGWCGTPMFRDIQALQLSDPIYIVTGWGTLLYRVCDIAIVTPEDNSWCQIREGQTLITLMTCHPYTQHYQRYVVFASLEKILDKSVLQKGKIREEVKEETEKTKDNSPRKVTEYDPDGTTRTVEVDSTSIEPDGSEYGSVWSNVMILTEVHIFRITVILTIVVILLGIYLLAETIKDRKREER